MDASGSVLRRVDGTTFGPAAREAVTIGPSSLALSPYSLHLQAPVGTRKVEVIFAATGEGAALVDDVRLTGQSFYDGERELPETPDLPTTL